LLARFADTLNEIHLTGGNFSFGSAETLVFPRVTKLDIGYWHSYHRTPIVKAFPAVIHLKANSSPTAASDKARWLVDMAERLDDAKLADILLYEGWQHLDHVEGSVLVIHALTVPSRPSVRRLCLVVDLDHSESVTRLCSTLETLCPTVLKLVLSSQDATDAKCLCSATILNAMASVRCLVFDPVQMKRVISRDEDGVLELYEFTVR
jgi:hypothetical protein